MVLDRNIQAVKEFFGIDKLTDWRGVRPEWIIGMHGIGQVTLDHIRMYLTPHKVTLKDDATPEFWAKHYSEARVCHTMGLEDRADVSPFTIVIDTREQNPFEFHGITGDAATDHRPIIVPTESRGLATGDYSVKGLESKIAIERKSAPDLYACMGRERERFEREVERLNEMEYAAVVCEADMGELATRPPERTKLDPKTVMRTIAAWSVRYRRVQWHCMPGRRVAEKWTFRLLQRCWIEFVREPGAAAVA